ncbi:MAG: hypothetical protein JW932_10495 [Deltaproteobacteria bacterium]|nr:hypothetical protein [Deltaproteobacteria bacterium]
MKIIHCVTIFAISVAVMLIAIPGFTIAQEEIPPMELWDFWGPPLMPEPEGLERKTLVFDGIGEREWYVYKPKSYTGKKSVPLVVAVHGGGLNGLIYSRYTTWSLIADREGFMVIYPSSPNDRWNAYYQFPDDPANPGAPDDLNYLKMLIEKTCDDYNIDKGRIYMQGHSMGDMMTSHFAVSFPGMLAAAAPNSGPVSLEMMTDINGDPISPPSVPVPIYRWHGELDDLGLGGPRQEIDDIQKQYWIEQNGCNPIPTLCINGRYNTEIYSCEGAEFRFTEYVGGKHGLNQSAANVIWNDFFSRFARSADGRIIKLKGPKNRFHKYHGLHSMIDMGCNEGVALLVGTPYALVDGNIIEMEVAPIIIEPVDPPAGERVPVEERADRLLVPLSFINDVFKVKVKWSDENGNIKIRHADKIGILTIDTPIMVINDDAITQLVLNPQIIDNIVMVPLKSIAENILEKNVAYSTGAMYVSDHEAQIDKATAHILNKILN